MLYLFQKVRIKSLSGGSEPPPGRKAEYKGRASAADKKPSGVSSPARKEGRATLPEQSRGDAVQSPIPSAPHKQNTN